MLIPPRCRSWGTDGSSSLFLFRYLSWLYRIFCSVDIYETNSNTVCGYLSSLMSEVTLRCSCGKVRGAARLSPGSGTRIVCYCGDCREFLTHLGGEKFLDPYGGAENFQIAPANFKITEGIEYVRCLRLTEKGMFRWYADCCKTPIGNTFSPRVPFISLFVAFFDSSQSVESSLGPVRGYVNTASATAPLPPEIANSSTLKVVGLAFSKLLIWKIRGLGQPSPLFDGTGVPISVPTILRNSARS